MKRIFISLVTLILVMIPFTKKINASTQYTINQNQHASIAFNPQVGEDLVLALHIPTPAPTQMPDMSKAKPTIVGAFKGNTSIPLGFDPAQMNYDYSSQYLTLTYSNSNFQPFDSSWMTDGMRLDIMYSDGNNNIFGVGYTVEFIKMKVQFFDNYGNNNSTTQFVAPHAPFQLPEPSPRAGYQFTGWYVDADAKNKYVSAPIYSDLNLYAGWTKLNLDTSMPTIDPNDTVEPQTPNSTPPSEASQIEAAEPAPSSSKKESYTPANPAEQKSGTQLPKEGSKSTNFLSGLGGLMLTFGIALLYLKRK